MRITVSLGQYVPGSSPLHRADPRAKVASVLVCMLATFMVSTPWQAALAAIAVCGLCLLAGQTPWSVLRSVWPVCLGLVAVACLNLFVTRTGSVVWAWGPFSVTSCGLSTAALFSLRCTLLVMCGAVLLACTTPTKLTQAFSSLLTPLKALHVPVDQLALVLSLALRFVPLLADEASSVMDAQTARGASFESGGVARRLAAMPALLVPVFAGALRHAQDLSVALEARGYDPDAPRTVWRPPHFGLADLALVLGTVAYVAALLLVGRL